MGDFDDVAASDSNELTYRSVRVTRHVEKYPASPEHALQRNSWHYWRAEGMQHSAVGSCGCVDASSRQINVIRCHVYCEPGLLLAAKTIIKVTGERRQLRAIA